MFSGEFCKIFRKTFFTEHFRATIFKTYLRRLQDVLKRSQRLTTKPDFLKTSGKRCLIYEVLKTSYLHRLEDAQFTTSWKSLIYDGLRKSDLWRLEDVRFTSSWKRPIYDVLKTSDLQLPEDVWLTTSWRHPIYVVLRSSNLQRL